MRQASRGAAALLCASLSACVPAGADPAYAGVLLPLPVGAQWDYRVVTSGGAVSARSEKVVGEDVIDGQAVAVVETTQDGTITRSYVHPSSPLVLVLQREVAVQGALGEAVRLLPGEPSGPLSAHQSRGARFDASWRVLPAAPGAETVTEAWVVEAVGEVVEVDAGRFRTVRVRRTRDGGAEAVLWFAPGVGLVRRDGEVRESLIGYSLP